MIEGVIPAPGFPFQTLGAGGHAQDCVAYLMKSHKVGHLVPLEGRMADHTTLRTATATTRTNKPGNPVLVAQCGDVVIKELHVQEANQLDQKDSR